MGNTPAFQYYPADLIADPEVMFWNMEQLGAYWAMISFLWQAEGYIDYSNNDEFFEKLRVIFRKKTRKTAKTLWEKIKKKFILEDGKYHHPRIIKEMQIQADNRLKRQEAGRLGGLAKAEKRSNAKISPVAKPSPSSSTSTTVINKYTLEECRDAASLIGISSEQVETFYHHYNSQGWVTGAGIEITDITSALVKWRNNGYKHERKAVSANQRQPQPGSSTNGGDRRDNQLPFIR